MTIEYRLMNAEEIEQLFDLWVEVYPETERESWKREFLNIPGSREHTYVAVDNGKVLSTALLWVREMNDSAGIAQRVGNIPHVATHPGARHQGHAKQLLGLVIEEMEQDNCGFSTLLLVMKHDLFTRNFLGEHACFLFGRAS
jgi:ribosomal protein S18 acetylase RimI-like enzyme